MSSDTEMSIRRGPMEFGEILGGAFKLTGRTFGSAGVVTVIAILLFSVVIAYTTQNYLSAVGASFSAASGINPEKDSQAFQNAMTAMIGPMITSVGVQFLYLLIIVFTQVLVALAGWYAAHNEKIGVGGLFSLAFKRSYWMAAIQTIMLAIFFIVVMMGLAIVVAILARFTGDVATTALMPVLYVAIIWFLVKTVTRLQLIAIEDRGPWQGLMASLTLSKGNWWRSFAAVLVPTVVMGAVTILSSILMMGGKGLFDMPMGMNAGPSAATENYALLGAKMKEMANALTLPFFLVSGFIMSIYLVYLTHVTTLLYIDLKGRRGDFDAIEEVDG